MFNKHVFNFKIEDNNHKFDYIIGAPGTREVWKRPWLSHWLWGWYHATETYLLYKNMWISCNIRESADFPILQLIRVFKLFKWVQNAAISCAQIFASIFIFCAICKHIQWPWGFHVPCTIYSTWHKQQYSFQFSTRRMQHLKAVQIKKKLNCQNFFPVFKH